MKFSTRDPIVAEVRKARSEMNRRRKRNPDKFWKEMDELQQDVEKYGIKKAMKMRQKPVSKKK